MARLIAGLLAGLATTLIVASPAYASDDPEPFNKFTAETAKELFVTAAGLTPYGEIPVVVFKAVEFDRKIGELAIKREDEVVRGELILISRDAARLKALHERGDKLATSSEAQVIKNRLQQLAKEMNSGDQNSVGHIMDMIEKHWVHVATSMAFEQSIKAATSWFFSESFGGRLLRKVFPAGDWANSLFQGKRSPLPQVFKFFGWNKLNARAVRANHFADKLAEKMADFEMAKIMKGIITSGADRSVEDLMNEALKDHPSRVVLQYRINRMLAVQPAALQPVAAQVLAVPLPVVAVAVARDPVVRAVVQQENYRDVDERWTIRSSEPATARGDNPASEPKMAKTDAPEKTAQQLRFHEELMRVGDGKTYSIGPLSNHSSSWDGRRGTNLSN